MAVSGARSTSERAGRPLSDFEATLAMGAIAIDPVDPKIIYAGTGEANYAGDNLPGEGLLKSTDGGATWSLGSRFASRFHELHVNSVDRTELWAATREGLFRSNDSGSSWVEVMGGLPGEDVTGVLLSSGTPGVLLAGVGRGFGQSANTGLYRFDRWRLDLDAGTERSLGRRERAPQDRSVPDRPEPRLRRRRIDRHRRRARSVSLR